MMPCRTAPIGMPTVSPILRAYPLIALDCVEVGVVNVDVVVELELVDEPELEGADMVEL